MHTTDLIIYLILSLGATWSYVTHKLTLTGSFTGAAVGFLVYESTGLSGIGMMTLFFILGSAATGWKRSKKNNDKDHGPRTATQVLANSGVAGILSMIAWRFPGETGMAKLMIAGSFAAATADTLSSELGTVYGRKFYHILTFKKDQRGLDGVVSLEGTLIGLIGAALIASVYALSMGWSIVFVWIVIAGFTGNLVDSILGALLERQGIIGNNLVNFLNTLTGALVSLILL